MKLILDTILLKDDKTSEKELLKGLFQCKLIG